jgi:hypothetical protein
MSPLAVNHFTAFTAHDVWVESKKERNLREERSKGVPLA